MRVAEQFKMLAWDQTMFNVGMSHNSTDWPVYDRHRLHFYQQRVIFFSNVYESENLQFDLNVLF